MKHIKIFEEFVYGDLEKDQWVESPYMNKTTPLQYRVSPARISNLAPNEVFVFGSNLQGIHRDGAAALCVREGWADSGQVEGISRSGKAYGIPTQSSFRALPISEIERYINNFLNYAKKNPNKKFLVTAIGTGHAGYTPSQMAQMFSEAENIPNIYLPQLFIDNL